MTTKQRVPLSPTPRTASGGTPSRTRRRDRGRRWRVAAGVAGGVLIAATAAVLIARFTFQRQISREVTALFAARADGPGAAVTEAEIANLPEPVQRWLRASGVVGRERPTTVRLTYTGEFRLGEDKGWMPFDSETYYTTDPPALLWTVTMRMFPLVSITGRDRYARGEGSIHMRVLSLVPVANKSGGGLNQGSLLRYLGETIWFPSGTLSPYITWESIDANSARATMTYQGVSGSLTFFFDAEGRVIRQEAAGRNNDATGRPERWSIPITAYGVFDGVLVPAEGEAVWNYATGDFSYIRMRITDIEYNRPEQY